MSDNRLGISSSMKSPSPMNNNGDNGVDDDNNNNNLLFDILIYDSNEFNKFVSWINKLQYDTDSLLYDLEDYEDDEQEEEDCIINSNIYKYFSNENKLFLFSKFKKILKKYKGVNT